ncbi:MAG TPA: DUF2188 domain-containing protein [Firmicutes bacterium]|jgi:hypothetical protein|nr:unknown [Clostridium sp. CAG:288]HAR47409.1 DUF2188 domain-containing protein [Bacillota bacterium]HAX00540.1 DUF2188 domain-containing protein [Bacillota bacterium]HCY68477.1 DUF2188 domain-containing protein [Bacillota bacterium]
MTNKTKVICRPCKEEHNWEIVSPNGKTMKQHYDSKASAVKAARKYANEHGADLYIMDYDNKQSSK